jgi:hypothetical protein
MTSHRLQIRKFTRRRARARKDENDAVRREGPSFAISISELEPSGASAVEVSPPARLLLHALEWLEHHQIRCIEDPRVSPRMRALWDRLIDSEALDEVSLDQMGRIWRIESVPRGTVLCGTAVASDCLGTSAKTREPEPCPRQDRIGWPQRCVQPVPRGNAVTTLPRSILS